MVIGINFYAFLFAFSSCFAYKPVFIIHGILSENSTMIELANAIQQYHPGTKVYVSSIYCGFRSLEPMMHQVQHIGPDVVQVSVLHPEGFHLIGYSQGGLLARAILEVFYQHRVHTFISLSSPQAGQYGTEMIKPFFPGLVRTRVYELFYSRIGQEISVANYWNDPHHQQLFYKYSKFLPVINNEVSSDNTSQAYKSGITKLKNMVLIGGPDDGTIAPWQSSQFGVYDADERVIPMRRRKIYKKDLFGLRTLDKRGALHLETVAGVGHHQWYRNLTVIKNQILPWLT